MTITVEACAALAQIYSVGILTVAVELRFVRSWYRGQLLRVARIVIGLIALVGSLAGLMAVVFMAQAVLFDRVLEGLPSYIVQYSGFALCVAVGCVIGGALVTNGGIGTRGDEDQGALQDGIATSVAAGVAKALRDRDSERQAQKPGGGSGKRGKKNKRLFRVQDNHSLGPDVH